MTRMERLHPDGWFGWERPGIDFPFYNDESLPLWHALLLIGSSLGVAIIVQLVDAGRMATCFIVLLGTLLPFLFVSRCKLGTLVKKPQKGDMRLALSMLGLYYLYAIPATLFLQYVLHVNTGNNPVLGENMDAVFWVLTLLQLFGEELIKINLFLGLMMLVYHFTNNRKLGIVVGTVCCLILFGLAHFATYRSLAQVLLIQGLGSICQMYCYLKTKNILVGYVSHVLSDAIIFMLVIVGAVGRR